MQHLSERESELLRNWLRLTAKLLLLTPVTYEVLRRELDAVEDHAREKLEHED